VKQVTQTLRTGKIEVEDVPVPTLSDKFLLVRNQASLISAGTEKTKIDIGNKNLLQKAKARPDLVRQVVAKIQREGLMNTLQTVNARLDAPSALGYSSAGSVVAVGGHVLGLQPSDRVACAGADYASHAEFVAVPRNLVAKIPDGVSDLEASFTTIGAIALQGVRLADPKIGETFLVIGLGLVGQIAAQILQANGCLTIGYDLNPDLVTRSETYGVHGAETVGLAEDQCLRLSNGRGIDGVIICAGTSSNELIELAGQVTREKGRVVVVGAVGMDVPREPYYMKEISLVISRSYGPGRYDPSYEEGGHDYPYGYVRFTEQRNMESFLQLLDLKRVDVQSLITHKFPIDDANQAYELIAGKRTEPYLGIVLTYPESATTNWQETTHTGRRSSTGKINLSVIGAGNYATAMLLPNLAKDDRVIFNGLITASGRTAPSIARKFKFDFVCGTFEELLSANSQAIVIASRHDTHAQLAEQAINNNLSVFVEKPLGITIDDLKMVHAAMSKKEDARLMIGFNRRFSPAASLVREHFKEVSQPKQINIRVNAGKIPATHWINDPEVGGGRLIGECCHFIDLAAFLSGSSPASVFAVGVHSSEKTPVTNDNLSITISMENGSVAHITYTSEGSSQLPKEYIEVFGGGLTAVIDDFQSVDLMTQEKKRKVKFPSQDKGQKKMLEAWIDSLVRGDSPITYREIMKSSTATILAVESLATGLPLRIESVALGE
jgi:predicted dehydrogenase/threonine dehydrogenase-like Zn-dependent dehydrogenase